MNAIDRVMGMQTTPEAKLQAVTSIAKALEFILESRQKWAWRLGPDAWIEITMNGHLGAAEMDVLLHYVVALRETVRPPSPPPLPGDGSAET